MTFGLPFRYETGPDGFILSGPKYFKKFHDIMLSMVTRYGVNMFKVDGIGFEGNHTVIATEMEGMYGATSTSFWTISRAHLSYRRPCTRRVICST